MPDSNSTHRITGTGSADTDHHQYDPHRLIFHMSLAGVLICAMGLCIALIAMFQHIGFDIINLRIDKLGDYVTSPYAYVYNIGLMCSGASFMLGMYGLYLLKFDRLSHALSIAGMSSGIGISLIGIFPYNDTFAHNLAALFFLLSTLAMFSLLVVAHKVSPRLCNRPLASVSMLGIILTSLLFAQIDPQTLDYVQCDPNVLCWPAITIWLHTVMTMFAGIGLALTAKAMANFAAHASTDHTVM